MTPQKTTSKRKAIALEPPAKPTLLVLAAGMGRRYGGLKQLDGIGPHGETLLEYAVYDAIRAGFGHVVFVLRRDFQETFEREVAPRFRRKIAVDYAFQEIEAVPEPPSQNSARTKPWGTGHAVLVAKKQVETPFAVINADDYYGPQAYVLAARFLEQKRPPQWPAPFGMVAFTLARTLSRHGGVSRGLCTLDSKGQLAVVEERTGIESTPTGIVARDGKTPTELPPTAPTSLNFFLFAPSVFEFLDDQFIQFLSEHGHEREAEFFLPTAVATLIKRGQATVAVETTSEDWIGVTYPEDREQAQERLARLHASGVYPENLWA